MDKEQLIQAYIANKLPEPKREEVHNLLETDADFKNAFETHSDVTFAYKLSEAERIKAHFQKLEQEMPKKNSFGFNRYKILYLAVASVLIIGLFYSYNQDVSGEDLFNSNFEIYPNIYQPVTRSTSENNNAEAFVAYENNDFERAEIAFENLLKIDNDINLRFYYALSLLNQSKFDLALEQLEQLYKLNHYYKDEVIWYAALTYLKLEDFENAKSRLEALENHNSTFKSNERKSLLKALQNR